MGWIKLNSLNPKIKNELLKITLGNFTDPIVIPGGFLILKIENEREVSVINDIDKELEIITNEVANKHNLSVIEDAAPAIGATHKGKKAGRLGDIAGFSFFPDKNMTTGEGGMVVTDNSELEEKCIILKIIGAS